MRCGSRILNGKRLAERGVEPIIRCLWRAVARGGSSFGCVGGEGHTSGRPPFVKEWSVAKKLERRERRTFIEGMRDEIAKMAKGLRRGEFDAFEMYGITLRGLSDNGEQVDMHMAVLFALLPKRARQKLLKDTRLEESETILPMLKKLRKKSRRKR